MMKRNILRAALAAGILGISATSFAGGVDIPFTGIVDEVINECSIDLTSGGILALASNRDELTSSPSSGAVRGDVFVNCIDTGSISITTPTAGPGDATTLAEQSGYTSGAELYSASTGGSLLTSDATGATTGSTSDHYYPHMWAKTSGNSIPVGQYNYVVTITVTAD